MKDHSTQSSKLLPSLFKSTNETQRLTVLHIGPALADTVDFFSHYRCKLHFVDLFNELPLQYGEDALTLVEQFQELVQFPADTRFDVCLFWDLFNHLDGPAIEALITVLRNYLGLHTLAHVFSAHNPRSEQNRSLYGIRDIDAISIRHRQIPLPNYKPHSQRKLAQLLDCFKVERSVLLADSRLELLLKVRQGNHL